MGKAFFFVLSVLADCDWLTLNAAECLSRFALRCRCCANE